MQANLDPAKHIIFVGDVHAVPAEIADCQRLIAGIATLRQYADTIVFLGDQFHTHAVVHLSVVAFWRETFRALQTLGFKVVALVGNHDIGTSGVLWPNAMQALEGTGVTVIDRPMEYDGIMMMPYVHDPKDFIERAQKARANTRCGVLVCHQTFIGAQYDNGFYAPGGVDLSQVPFELIISGHIHGFAWIGNLCYVGSPRWRTRDDANKAKAVRLFNKEAEKFVESFDTSAWCSAIYHWELGPDSEPPPEAPAGARVTVTLRGPADWVRAEAPGYKEKGFGVRRLPDAVASPRVRESAPVSQSFADFLKAFKTPNGSSPEVLERLVSQCLST